MSQPYKSKHLLLLSRSEGSPCTKVGMAIPGINFLRSRKTPTKESQEAGGGDQFQPPTEVTEVAVIEKESQHGSEIEIEIEVIITQYRQKKWFLIRLSSLFYFISVLFLILVSLSAHKSRA